MGKMTAITAEVDEETLAVIDELASGAGQSREVALAELARFHGLTDDPRLGDRLAQAARIGVEAIERGEVVPHEEVLQEIDEMIARHRAR